MPSARADAPFDSDAVDGGSLDVENGLYLTLDPEEAAVLGAETTAVPPLAKSVLIQLRH